jgi:hypothetical protein
LPNSVIYLIVSSKVKLTFLITHPKSTKPNQHFPTTRSVMGLLNS